MTTIYANMSFYVMQDCPQDVVLGIDTLTSLGHGSFLFKPGYFYFGETPVRLLNLAVVASTIGRSPATNRLVQNITLPPKTATMVFKLTDNISRFEMAAYFSVHHSKCVCYSKHYHARLAWPKRQFQVTDNKLH